MDSSDIHSRNFCAGKRQLSLLLAIGAFLLGWPVSGQGVGQPVFTEPEASPITSDDGTVALAWAEDPAEVPEQRVYEVRRWDAGSEGEGVLVYEGPDTATFLSGLPEGEFALRIRARSPEGDYPDWSGDHLTVKVEYIETWLVIALMSAGLITFIAIVLAIALGHRNALREESANR